MEVKMDKVQVVNDRKNAAWAENTRAAIDFMLLIPPIGFSF